jgi:hypothetical protein
VSNRFANWNEQSRLSTNRSYSPAWKILDTLSDANTGPRGESSAGPPSASGSIRKICRRVATWTRQVLSK